MQNELRPIAPSGEPQFGRGMRWLLMSCGPMNVMGAIWFAPPFDAARQLLGLPEPDGFYLWVLASWILAFGVAYFHQGWTGEPNRAVLALGAWGKLMFSSQLMLLAARLHLSPLAWGATVPDLVCALLFGWWLWRHPAGTAIAMRANLSEK